MRTIRTTMNPDKEIEVSAAEFKDLSRQGLIHEEPEETAPKKAETTKKEETGGGGSN